MSRPDKSLRDIYKKNTGEPRKIVKRGLHGRNRSLLGLDTGVWGLQGDTGKVGKGLNCMRLYLQRIGAPLKCLSKIRLKMLTIGNKILIGNNTSVVAVFQESKNKYTF